MPRMDLQYHGPGQWARGQNHGPGTRDQDHRPLTRDQGLGPATRDQDQAPSWAQDQAGPRTKPGQGPSHWQAQDQAGQGPSRDQGPETKLGPGPSRRRDQAGPGPSRPRTKADFFFFITGSSIFRTPPYIWIARISNTFFEFVKECFIRLCFMVSERSGRHLQSFLESVSFILTEYGMSTPCVLIFVELK